METSIEGFPVTSICSSLVRNMLGSTSSHVMLSQTPNPLCFKEPRRIMPEKLPPRHTISDLTRSSERVVFIPHGLNHSRFFLLRVLKPRFSKRFRNSFSRRWTDTIFVFLRMARFQKRPSYQLQPNILLRRALEKLTQWALRIASKARIEAWFPEQWSKLVNSNIRSLVSLK